MISRHLIEGDGNGNKLEAVSRHGYVEFVDVIIVRRDEEHQIGMDVRNRHRVRISKPMYYALHDNLRAEDGEPTYAELLRFRNEHE